MKRSDTFGEYMFALLFAPLKRGKRAVNQFYIFFKVTGRIFDSMKKDVFRVRNEANVASASPAMLPVHGQDRDMTRLEGEDVESYRTRLSMKGVISEWSGTKTGILYVLTALGYDGKSTVEPLFRQDSDRWAEFLVRIQYDLDGNYTGLEALRKEVRKIKQASSRDNYEVAMMGNVPVDIEYFLQLRLFAEVNPRRNMERLKLDGTWKLDGTRQLSGYKTNAEADFFPMSMQIQTEVRQETSVSAGTFVRLKLDGTWKLDGTRKLNGGEMIL